LARLAIDRSLTTKGNPAGLGPGANDDDDEITPATRLQTVLPLLRATIAVLIGAVAVLVALSELGVNTAPLIAGAGVFGLAVSFGSQSLVRDVISGVFYMWDDAFRVGEYIDTGRLKGTVEALGVRSVRLRHQNGPLHTIPYGQLGAVTISAATSRRSNSICASIRAPISSSCARRQSRSVSQWSKRTRKWRSRSWRR
jgi:small-conductance mechanosensitive channel